MKLKAIALTFFLFLTAISSSFAMECKQCHHKKQKIVKAKKKLKEDKKEAEKKEESGSCH